MVGKKKVVKGENGAGGGGWKRKKVVKSTKYVYSLFLLVFFRNVNARLARDFPLPESFAAPCEKLAASLFFDFRFSAFSSHDFPRLCR